MPVHAVLYGEAPGPRGADKSGHPFWGDQAGRLLFKGLHRAGYFQAVTIDRGDLFGARIEAVGPSFDDCDLLKPWNGERLGSEHILPVLDHIAISNAWPCCPTKDGEKFYRPTPKQMGSVENISRIKQEVETARVGATNLKIVCLGTAAAWVFQEAMAGDPWLVEEVYCLPHPAPQGILSMGRKGDAPISVPGLRETWITMLLEALKRN
jgi:hypothetical protein